MDRRTIVAETAAGRRFKRAPLLGAAFALLFSGHVSSQQITLVAGGDIEWSRATKAPAMFYDAPPSGRSNAIWDREDGWIRVPYSASERARRHLEAALDTTLTSPEAHHLIAFQHDLAFENAEDEARYPFRRIVQLLRDADIAFANLETPLSDDARWSGAFRTPSSFADGLAWAGIDVVSTANNHALDAEGDGLLDTIEHLAAAGIGHAGTGDDLASARAPFILERNGVRIAVLAYAQLVNVGGSAFATRTQSGVAPMDPLLIADDIVAAREDADVVVVSFHWGIENDKDVHPGMRDFAHDIIDAGADIILGHHPHVPRGIEVYEGKAIVYSLGNFVFGHGHSYWGDNILVRLTLSRTPEGTVRTSQIEVLPIAGHDDALAQPFLLDGPAAATLLEDLRRRSADLGTDLQIEGSTGLITP